ncbi:RHS repeat-associated core domain-containing protein [Nitrosomonas sp. sh817]|uniref:RHS repeat-associated core domain-containing protein n=1 Tax=Nitrosomonas sp. sh817 TaxID=3070658 RepID=UPI0027DDFD9F|nr:RHS repeat-associated core domain-containing protein [Nitrosomonas sp. sh817]WMJ08683.1 RHS repeat-associated core domain-containing protein [Nitrosomonas sp. sh817]
MFFYDSNRQLIGEYRDNASTTTPTDDWLVRQETIWLNNIPVGVITKPTATSEIQVSYIHADHLNTPRVIVDQTNTIVWRWDNTHAFGANLPNEDPDGNGQLFEYHPRFPGQYFDKETGLHYNYFRYYEPETGRYLSPDPIGLAAGMNVWGYVGGNPVLNFDLLGLELISFEEGQRITEVARTWSGVPYYENGGARSSRDRADCSGSIWKIYEEAGYPYEYSNSKMFPDNPRFKPAPNNKPQPGDVGQWNGHVLIFDPKADARYDSWSARRPGVPFGAAQIIWWEKSMRPVTWYRYDKPINNIK